MTTTRQRPVTRIEIAVAVQDAFALDGPVERHQLIRAASFRGARRDVVVLLERLPASQFGKLQELWRHLPDLPVGE